MTVFTIGFTKKTAEQFFETLKAAGVKRVLDVRLHNVSQLAGFSKKDDLSYLLKAIGRIDYRHLPELAPTENLLSRYQQDRKAGWPSYQKAFQKLLADRKVEKTIPRAWIQSACFLCSEASPEQCHRRLVVDYLHEKWGNLQIQHL